MIREKIEGKECTIFTIIFNNFSRGKWRTGVVSQLVEKKKKKKEMREVDDTTKCKMIFARNYRISFIYHRTEYWLIRESDIKLMVVENTSSRFKITFTCYWYVVQTLISQIRVFFFLSFNMTDQTRVNKIATAREYISSSSRKTSKYAFLIICSSYIVHSFVSVFADPYLIGSLPLSLLLVYRFKNRDPLPGEATCQPASPQLSFSFIDDLIKLEQTKNQG